MMKKLVVIVGSALFAVALGSAPASASAHDADQGADAASPWIRYEQSDLTIPAGRGCDFEVFEEVLVDEEYYRNVDTYDDGAPKTQHWKGPLVMRFTNTETGASVVRDLSGHATIEYRADGSLASITSRNGHFGSTLPPGSNVSRGVYVMSGRGTSVTFHPDDTRTLTLGKHGSAENLCGVLDDE